MNELQRIEAESRRLWAILHKHGVYEVNDDGQVLVEKKKKREPSRQEIVEAMRAYPLISEWIGELAKSKSVEGKLELYKIIKEELYAENEKNTALVDNSNKWLKDYDAVQASYNRFLQKSPKLTELQRGILNERFWWLFKLTNIEFDATVRGDIAEAEKRIPMLSTMITYANKIADQSFTKEELQKYFDAARLYENL